MGSMACKQEVQKSKAINKADMDVSVNPADDFDNYANGGWKKRFPIPDEKSRFGSFDLLMDTGEIQVKNLISEIATQRHEAGSVAQKIADFYNTGMDTAKIESEGISPIQAIFDQINAIQNKADVMNVLAEPHTLSIFPMFTILSEVDQKNSEMMIAYVMQGGLGMPDRDYYMKDDDRSKEIQAAYLLFLQKMFVLTGTDNAISKSDASIIYNLEKRLAAASMTKLELRDPQNIYHKMNMDGIRKIAPEMDWSAYFQNIGLQNPGDFIVGQPDFMKEIGKMFGEVSVNDWKIYLRWNVMNSTATYLPTAFVDENFEFFGKTLSGQMAQRPRWKSVQEATNNALSEAIGQMYVQKYFPAEAKTRMLDLVGNLRNSLGERIKQLAWMSDVTKAKAIEKLDAITVKIGYPDKWRDYSALQVSTDSYVSNVFYRRGILISNT